MVSETLYNLQLYKTNGLTFTKGLHNRNLYIPTSQNSLLYQ